MWYYVNNMTSLKIVCKIYVIFENHVYESCFRKCYHVIEDKQKKYYIYELISTPRNQILHYIL